MGEQDSSPLRKVMQPAVTFIALTNPRGNNITAFRMSEVPARSRHRDIAASAADWPGKRDHNQHS